MRSFYAVLGVVVLMALSSSVCVRAEQAAPTIPKEGIGIVFWLWSPGLNRYQLEFQVVRRSVELERLQNMVLLSATPEHPILQPVQTFSSFLSQRFLDERLANTWKSHKPGEPFGVSTEDLEKMVGHLHESFFEYVDIVSDLRWYASTFNDAEEFARLAPHEAKALANIQELLKLNFETMTIFKNLGIAGASKNLNDMRPIFEKLFPLKTSG